MREVIKDQEREREQGKDIPEMIVNNKTQPTDFPILCPTWIDSWLRQFLTGLGGCHERRKYWNRGSGKSES